MGQGASSARPIWAKFMTKVYADPSTGITKGQFKRPSSGLDISLDRYKEPSDSVKVRDEEPEDIKN